MANRRETVCSEFDKDTEIEQLRETLEVEYGNAGSAAAKLDAKLKVVRHLKRLFRCGGSFEDGADEVTALAPEIEAEVRQSAVTVLGGHLVGTASSLADPGDTIRPTRRSPEQLLAKGG